MAKHDMDSKKVEEAFKKSFEGEDNTYLKRSHDLLENSGITKFPAVTINGIKMKGSLNVALCLSRPSSSLMMSATPCWSHRLPAINMSPSNPLLSR